MADNILEQARNSFQVDTDTWSENYRKSSDDLKFLSDDPYAQWEGMDFKSRIDTSRPAITIDQLGQFIHQTANDIRMNTPSINVIPANDKASEQAAEVFKGLIREIEYYSNADDVYDTASLNSIRCGIGFMRIELEDDDNGLQRLCIKRVVNPLAVYIDSNSIECDGRDAKHAFIIDKMSAKEFAKRFPNKAPVCFENGKETSSESSNATISVAEYFVINDEGVVERYLLSGADVLEEGTFPGKYIPIVPVYGEETWIDGKRYLFSLIRKAKQPQQMLNLWASLETELLMKAPQAPVMVAEGQIDDYAADWKNPSKSMALRYKTQDVEGNPIPPPIRLEPPTIPTGVVNARRQAVEDIKASMGIYNAGLGQQGNEVSGLAIKRKQQEGDVATFHFQDNLIRSIVQMGRILVKAIPEVYIGERMLTILGLEEDVKQVKVNNVEDDEESISAALDIETEVVNLARGSYDVRVKTGGSFTTRREEAAEFLTSLLNVSPEMMNVMGDLMFENQDFAGANVMAERMKKVIDPKFLDESGEDPQVQALMQQMQQAQQIIEGLQAQLGSKDQEMQLKATAEQNDADEAVAKTQMQLLELQLKQQQAQADNEIKQAELALREKELQLKEAELQIELIQGRGVDVSV